MAQSTRCVLEVLALERWQVAVWPGAGVRCGQSLPSFVCGSCACVSAE